MILNADALHIPLADKTVQTCVTSPPYYGLRDYGVAGQIGLEETPEAYVEKLVAVFCEVRRVLRDDGCIWVNLGDSYWGGKGKSGYELPDEAEERRSSGGTFQTAHNVPGYRDMRPTDGKHEVIKPKDLIGIPWRVAFALQADGWYLRSDIIWHKPNPMPESVTDRPTKAHEYIFLLSKNAKYFYDAEAIKEKRTSETNVSGPNSRANVDRVPRKNLKQDMLGKNTYTGFNERWSNNETTVRNRRSVWTVATQPYYGAHFATFPEKLIEPCILAGSAEGDIVIDPFFGSGTTGMVALKHRRRFAGLELNMEYIGLSKERTTTEVMLPMIV